MCSKDAWRPRRVMSMVLFDAIRMDDIDYVMKHGDFDNIYLFESLGIYSPGGARMDTPMCVAIAYSAFKCIDYFTSIGMSRLHALHVIILDKIKIDITQEEIERLSAAEIDFFLQDLDEDESKHPLVMMIKSIREAEEDDE